MVQIIQNIYRNRRWRKQKTFRYAILPLSTTPPPSPPPLHPTPSPPPPPNGLSVIGGLWKVKTLSSIFPGRCGKVNYGLFSCITFLTAGKKGEKFMFQITICKSKTFVGQRNCMSFYEQTNERTNERRTNERTNEWMNPRFVHEKPGPIKWNLFSDTFMNYLVFIILRNKS